MGIRLYKDGDTCNADPDQIPAMEATGWSRKAPTEEASQTQAETSQEAKKEGGDDKPKAGAVQSPASS